MNEEIKNLIAEEADKYSERIKKNTSFKLNERIAATAGFARGATIISEIILSKWQEDERWRKVEEEPTNQDIVLVKTDKCCFATAYYHGKNIGWIVYGDEAYKQFGNITEWKPIS